MTSPNSSGGKAYAPLSLSRLIQPNVDSIFKVYTAQDFAELNTNSNALPKVAIFLYRVARSSTNQNVTGRLLPNGRHQFNQLSLDLNLLVVIWAKDAETQHRLAGWVMRTLEDYSDISASLLNHGSREIQIDDAAPDDNGVAADTDTVFRDNESVSLLPSEIGAEELLQLWDTLGNGAVSFPISIPYLVRNVCIESYRDREPEVPVQLRVSDMQRLQEKRV